MSQENSPVPQNSTEETVSQDSLPAELTDILEEHIREVTPQQDEHPAPSPASMADFAHFLQAIKAAHDAEKKLEMTIDFMQQRLAQTGVPHFKEFWDARRLCLDLFKENISPSVRVHLWARYSELCRQARKLKEIFDEQSAFAAEQIEMAVTAIEAEVLHFPEFLQKMSPIDFGIECRTLETHFEQYNELQRELNLLNAYATKTSSLRKELIKTEMRIRTKNKFFERLSKLGDSVFPRRKELIQKVSELFTNDVEHFIETTFTGELKTTELFDAREEIKALQSVAKILTLNTESFSQTRQRLSECWDSIKNVVRERRKVVSEQKATYKKHRDELMEALEALKTSFEAKEFPTSQLEVKLDDVVNRMRKTPLGKLEIRELRDKVRDLRQVLTSQAQNEDAQRKQEAMKKENERFARVENLKNELQELLQGNQEADELEKSLQQLSKEVGQLSLMRQQKQEFDRLQRNVRDRISEKREKTLLSLSDDDRQAVDQLKALLKERKKHRQEIKTQLEQWRKESGSSGLDFTEALAFTDMIANEKERLEKIEMGIEEIEEKITKLQGRA